MFGKVLVANRGEIAVRAFRAAYELGVKTVAVFPYEDRNAIHRIKADEAYLIGERGHPVRGYLDIHEIMRAAKESDADAIYPGYGFLSENPELARACAEAGITFIGPPAEVLELAGNKVRAIQAAQGGSRRHRLSGIRQSRCRRWWPGHAPGQRSRAARRIYRRRHARG
jgi:pyruvate carboxylase